MWEAAPTAVFARYPFPPSIAQMRHGGHLPETAARRRAQCHQPANRRAGGVENREILRDIKAKAIGIGPCQAAPQKVLHQSQARAGVIAVGADAVDDAVGR